MMTFTLLFMNRPIYWDVMFNGLNMLIGQLDLPNPSGYMAFNQRRIKVDATS